MSNKAVFPSHLSNKAFQTLFSGGYLYKGAAIKSMGRKSWWIWNGKDMWVVESPLMARSFVDRNVVPEGTTLPEF